MYYQFSGIEFMLDMVWVSKTSGNATFSGRTYSKCVKPALKYWISLLHPIVSSLRKTTITQKEVYKHGPLDGAIKQSWYSACLDKHTPTPRLFRVIVSIGTLVGIPIAGAIQERSGGGICVGLSLKTKF